MATREWPSGTMGIPGKWPHALAASLVIGTLFLLACTGGEGAPTSTSPSPSVPAPELQTTVISTDLSKGPNRLAFALLESAAGTVNVAEADVSLYYPANAASDEPRQVAKARFRKWPLGSIGVYTSQVNFDQAGTWDLRVSVTAPDGSTKTGRANLEVKYESTTPAIGSPAPPSLNKTSRDVAGLEELTSDPSPDPDLYSMTVADAVASGKPLVVVFATPAFCQTTTCGPQVEVLRGVKDRYKDRVHFIHVEMFDNPHEIKGDLSRGRTAPAVGEWGLLTEPWTFIVDRQGNVAAKFEAFTTAEEIEEQLVRILQ